MFFSNTRQYLVLGASSNPQKFGYRVLRWYLGRKLPVYPVNPKSSSILDVKCSTDINSFIKQHQLSPSGLGVSVIVPPNVSLKSFQDVVNEGNSSHIKSIWFQPGSFDDQVVDYVKNNFELDELIADGSCILVRGISKLHEDL